jgi:hypothetical protein
MARRTGLAAIVALIVLTALPAFAQESAADCERARELFEDGTTAVDQGRLAEGRDLLRSAAELCPIVQVYFNLGYALRRSGFTTESIQIFDALLRGEHGVLGPEQDRAIREELAGAERELATLRLSVVPAGAGAIELDGRAYGTMTEGAPFELRTDAGTHVVSASFDDYFGEARVELGRGENRALTLELVEIDDGGVPLWIWIAGGSAIAIGVTVTIILLTLPDSLGEPVGTVIKT